MPDEPGLRESRRLGNRRVDFTAAEPGVGDFSAATPQRT